MAIYLKNFLAIVCITLCLFAPGAFGQDQWQGVSKIVVFGDLHGDYEQYIKLLKQNELVDEALNWQGGDTHLVQLGDIFDRGPDSLKILRHLVSLKQQAKREKGYVHTLLGNHEMMNIRRDLRYVHPGEYQALVTEKSRILQERYLSRLFKHLKKGDPTLGERKEETLAELETTYPLGFVEHSYLWAPKGEIYKWARRQNTVIKINRTLFVHGGISPHQDLIAIPEINQRVRTAIRKNNDDDLLFDDGPLWYRGLARNKKDEEFEPLLAMLKFYDADAIVIAHTPTPGVIYPRFGGRVIMADVGISKVYGHGQASLLIEEGEMFAMHRGHKVAIPLIEEGLLTYFLALDAFEPQPSKLRKTIDRLEAKATAPAP